MGIPCLGAQWRTRFKHSEAFSFQVATADQAERIATGTRSSATAARRVRCGLVQGQVGLSWQDNADRPDEKRVTDPDRAAAKRAFDAMMQMKKIDIVAIEAARGVTRRWA